MELFLTYLSYYAFVAFGYLVVEAIVAGYYEDQLQQKDYISSLLWPVSIATLLGLFVRLIVSKVK